MSGHSAHKGAIAARGARDGVSNGRGCWVVCPLPAVSRLHHAIINILAIALLIVGRPDERENERVPPSLAREPVNRKRVCVLLKQNRKRSVVKQVRCNKR